MTTCKPCPTPIAPQTRLSVSSMDPLPDPTTYHSMVAGLVYLTLTCLNIAFDANQVCQFMHAPRSSHLQAVKRVFRYIKRTLTKGLTFYRSPHLSSKAYTDTDWAGDLDDRWSTTGSYVFIGSNLVSWSTKNQPIVSRSCSEAEYRVLATIIAEVRRFSYLFRELGIRLSQSPTLFCDNLSALHMNQYPVFHARTRHIEFDYDFVRELVMLSSLQLCYVSDSR